MEILDRKISDLTVGELINILNELKLNKSGTIRKPYTFNVNKRGIDRYHTDSELQSIIHSLYERDDNARMPSRDILQKVNEVYNTDAYILGVQLNKMGFKSKLFRIGGATCKAYRLKLK